MGCKVKELRFGLHKCRTPEPEETIEIPKTGDHACLPLWISLCGVCAAQMAGLFLYKRKNRRM